MNEVIAGIDIGGTKIAIALETLGGEEVASRRLPTEVENGAYAIVENISQSITKMLEENRVRLVSVGIGCPSPLDIEKGLVMSPSNLRDWDNFPIVKLVRERFKVPIVLDNDANTAALGEYVYGAGRGYQNVIYITVSTGIGGGIIINGKIHHGVAAGAGELGHTIVQPNGVRCNCGSVGCLETICAGVHIARRAREQLAKGKLSLMNGMTANINEVTAKTVVEAVRRKDKLAVEIWEETCRYLAIGIANSISLLAPEAVVIGGGIAAAAGELLFAPLRRLLPQFVSMVPAEKINILPAQLGSESAVRGALVMAKKAYSNAY
ncbi:MAG: ROK family protein [Acidobacteriota bacterium]|nr:ROK family protein [Acidobacteriota bacterium]